MTSVLGGLARWGVRGGGIMMLAAALLVSFDVLARKLFSVTVGGADELSGYAFAIACAWSFAFVTLDRMNVRVDALYRLLPGPLARLLDVFALLGITTFSLLLTRYGWEVVSASWSLSARSNSTLAIVLWVPQLLWWLGLALFSAACISLAVRAGAALLRGDWTRVATLAGARSALDEAAEEAGQVQQRLEAAGRGAATQDSVR